MRSLWYIAISLSFVLKCNVQVNTKGANRGQLTGFKPTDRLRSGGDFRGIDTGRGLLPDHHRVSGEYRKTHGLKGQSIHQPVLEIILNPHFPELDVGGIIEPFFVDPTPQNVVVI